MLSTSIFYSAHNILFSFLSLFIGFASIFLIREHKQFRELLYYQLAGLLLVCYSYLLTHEHILYSLGLNYHFILFIEMMITLLSSIFWIYTAHHINSSSAVNKEILIFYATIFLGSATYYSFFAYNRETALNINNILLSFTLFLTFISITYKLLQELSIKNFLLFCATFTLCGKVIVSSYFFKYNWLNLNIFNWIWTYIFAAAVVSIKINYLQEELKKSWNNIDKLVLQINTMIDSSPFPIILAKINAERILMMNNKAAELFGISKKEANYFKLKDIFVDDKNRQKLFTKLEKEHEVEDLDMMVCNFINSSPFWLSVSAKTIEYNNEMALYIAFQNITSRKKREDNLKFQADKDPLTLAWNRRYFEKFIPERIKESIKQSKYFSLLMIDADNFKNINDTYGHKSGDHVLIELAEICKNSLRENDVVCRFGGEEFIIYLDNTNTQSALLVAERLRKTIEDSIIELEDEQKIKFTVSIGVISSEKTDSLEILLKQADEAMYLAKHNGRNRCEIYNENAVKKIMNKKKTTNDQRNIHPVFQNEETEEISLLDNYDNKIM